MGERSALPVSNLPSPGSLPGPRSSANKFAPLFCVLMRVPITRERPRHLLAPLPFGRILPNPALRFWAESGAGSDPPPIVRSTAPESEPMLVLISVVRGRSQPAPTVRVIPAGRPFRADATTRVPVLVDFEDPRHTVHHPHHCGRRHADLAHRLGRVPRARCTSDPRLHRARVIH